MHMLACICAYLYINTYTHVCTYIHVRTYIHIYAYIHTFIYTGIYIYTYVYVCIYIHIYYRIYVYVQHVYIYADVRTYADYMLVRYADVSSNKHTNYHNLHIDKYQTQIHNKSQSYKRISQLNKTMHAKPNKNISSSNKKHINIIILMVECTYVIRLPCCSRRQ